MAVIFIKSNIKQMFKLLSLRRSVASSILTDEEFTYLEGVPACLMSAEETDTEHITGENMESLFT